MGRKAEKERETLRRFTLWVATLQMLLLEPRFVKNSFMVPNSPESLGHMCVSGMLLQMSHTLVSEPPLQPCLP